MAQLYAPPAPINNVDKIVKCYYVYINKPAI